MNANLSVTDKSVVDEATRVALLILISIRDAGEAGLPSGHLYVALASKGCSLQRYEGMMSSLQNTGMMRRRQDECLVITEAGKRGIERLEAGLALSTG